MADQASFAIEIAAEMSGGDQTIAELDALTAQLRGGGKNADFFSSAIAQVSKSLDAAKASTVAANAALAAGNEEYANLERAALEAAKAAERAGKKNGGVVPPEAADRAFDAAFALDKYTAELRQLEQSAARATKEEKTLAQTMANVRKLSDHTNKSIAANAERLGKLQGSLNAVGGPLGRFGSMLVAPVKGFSELSGSIGASRAAALLGVVGFAAVAAAIVAVGAAAAYAAVKVASWAVGLADSARSAALSREAVEALHPEIAALSGTYAQLADETGASAAELDDLAKKLKAAKVGAEDMPAALRAAALAEKALGKGGSEQFFESIKEGKKAVGELAAETEGKLGGIVAKQMRGLDAQSDRLGKNISKIFGGLNIEPVLSGFERLVKLFDENTAAGQTIKFLFEEIFQPLIDQIDTASVVLEAFALGFLIGMVKLYIALKPTIKAIKEFFGFEDTSLMDTLTDAKAIGEAVAPVFAVLAAVVGGVLLAAFVAVGAIIAIQVAIWYAIVEAVMAVVNVIGFVVEQFTWLFDTLSEIDLGEVGTNMMQGLVKGITGAAQWVKDAVTNTINAAIKSAKEALGISSPSKVFAEIGEFTGEGFSGGVEDSAPDAQGAMQAMVRPDLGAQGGGAVPSGGGSRVDLSGASFNFYGVKDAEHGADMFAEALTRVLEGDAAQGGTDAPP